MGYTNDFYIQAQGLIERCFRAERQALLEAWGKIVATTKSDNTVVTQLDTEIEERLRGELLKFDSSIGIEGEEHGIEGSRNTYWLVDPIDGTDAFIRGLPMFRNVITLIVDGQPDFTVIYMPATDELFVAARGEGAFRNGMPITVSARPLEWARIEVHSPGKKPEAWELLQKVAQKVSGIRITGDFVRVAEGKYDAFMVYKGGGGPWDFAPRALLIQEAGAKVTNIGKETYDFTENTMLAAHPNLHDELSKILRI